MATTTTTTTSTSFLSNAASVVGRHIRFLDTTPGGGRITSSQSAVISSYNPTNNAHTVEFQDGTEQVVILNKHRFKFLVRKCEAADMRGHKARMLLAAQRDAVGRPVKVFSDKRNKYIYGSITAFDEETGKHAITLKNKNKTVHHLGLQSKKLRWRYCDMIGGADRHPGSQSIISSKYAGVRRSTDSSWLAYKGAIGGVGSTERYIGTFTSEKDAALAYDFYARKQELNVINFLYEQLNEAEIEKRKSKHYDFSARAPARGHGKSKYRGVHWQKNRKRWMARYTLSHKGEKNINLGAFETAEYAAMAFDFEARKRGRPECDLNFAENRPTEEQIEQWKTNTAHYTMMRSGRERSSQYRGVTWHKGMNMWLAQCNIVKVVKGMGKETGPVPVGCSKHEAEAALAFDRACRKFGVPEKEFNFPRNHQLLNEVRLFDDECYFCFQKSPTDPVATPCNHVFCRACISSWLEQSPNGSCPCCNMPDLMKDALRSVTLVPWAVQPDLNKPRKRKRDDEKNQAPIAAAAAGAAAAKTASSNSSDSGTEDDDDDVQVGPPSDSDHDESDMRKASDDKRMKRGSKLKNDTHHENYSDDDAGEHDSQQRPKRRRATRSSTQRATRHTSSLAKSPGRATRRQQVKYPVGTRFIKEFKGHGKFEGRVVNYHGKHYKVYYPEDGDEESLSEYELDALDIVVDNDRQGSSGNDEDVDQSSDDEDDTSSIESAQPKFTIGTRFIKDFPGYGRFEGRVVDFDGNKRYEVHYPQDGDEEVINESELEKLEIILDSNES